MSSHCLSRAPFCMAMAVAFVALILLATATSLAQEPPDPEVSVVTFVDGKALIAEVATERVKELAWVILCPTNGLQGVFLAPLDEKAGAKDTGPMAAFMPLLDQVSAQSFSWQAKCTRPGSMIHALAKGYGGVPTIRIGGPCTVDESVEPDCPPARGDARPINIFVDTDNDMRDQGLQGSSSWEEVQRLESTLGDGEKTADKTTTGGPIGGIDILARCDFRPASSSTKPSPLGICCQNENQTIIGTESRTLNRPTPSRLGTGNQIASSLRTKDSNALIVLNNSLATGLTVDPSKERLPPSLC